MSAADKPLTAKEIAGARLSMGDGKEQMVCTPAFFGRLLDAAETLAERDAEIAAQVVEIVSLRERVSVAETAIGAERDWRIGVEQSLGDSLTDKAFIRENAESDRHRLESEIDLLRNTVESLRRQLGPTPAQDALAIDRMQRDNVNLHGRLAAKQVFANQQVAEIADLRARLERAEADAWIPVGERLPALDEPVFAASNGCLSVMARTDTGDGWLWAQQSHAWNLTYPAGFELEDDYQPTHWRPMFALPVAQADSEGGA